MNSIDGDDPPKPLQGPKVKLLVSAVVPASETQVGALDVPLDTAIFTVIDEPALNRAFVPSPLPITLTSDSFQPVARSTTVSGPVALYASVSVVKVTVSTPPSTAEPDTVRFASC